MIINKADYLTDELRDHWSAYFKQHNVNHLFFSALKEQEKIDKHVEDEKNDSDYEETDEEIE